jgi:hypothetical protein
LPSKHFLANDLRPVINGLHETHFETQVSATEALSSPKSCRRPAAVKRVIHNSRFDTLDKVRHLIGFAQIFREISSCKPRPDLSISQFQ